ncbi:DMT family transporter [Leptothrix discophora]|uniref:DMT family transporter n=1 Tax=Leptothrix discophora TaxID=89 RepID=A0ABT9G8U4_LEPDI|nr:DMT family transporter [Leptothrix discophora]MDP4302881.1 DMT family transporter [Leptothrix discophora]
MSAASRVSGLAVLALMFNALTWGLSWWPFRQLQDAGLHSLWSTVLIYGSAMVVVTVVRPRAWGQLLRQRNLWLIALASGCTNLGFNWGVTIGDVSRVVLLFYLTPLWTVALARWLLGEHADARVWLRVAMALAGAALVISAGHDGQAARPASMPRLADALALAAGFFFSLNNVMLRRSADLPEEGRALAMFGGGALVSLLVVSAGSLGLGGLDGLGMQPPPPVQASWLLPAMGLALAFLLSNLSLQYGAARLPANVTSVVMPCEVVFASLSAVWWAGEVLGPMLLIGGALILGATLLAAWQGR